MVGLCSDTMRAATSVIQHAAGILVLNTHTIDFPIKEESTENIFHKVNLSLFVQVMITTKCTVNVVTNDFERGTVQRGAYPLSFESIATTNAGTKVDDRRS